MILSGSKERRLAKKQFLKKLQKYKKKKEELQQLYTNLVRLGATAGMDDEIIDSPVHYEFPEQFQYKMIEKRGGENR